MNRLQIEFCARILREASLFCTVWFFYWAFIHEMGNLGKPWNLAILSSLQNWLLFVIFLMLTAMADFYLAHPEGFIKEPKTKKARKKGTEPKKEEEKEVERLPLY